MYVHCSTPSPTFSSVSLYGQPFARYCTFQDFPIDSHVKISKCHFFFNFGRSPIYTCTTTFYSVMTTLFIIKFGSDGMKTGGGVAFWNVCSHSKKKYIYIKIRLKIANFGKKMIWRYGGRYPQNLAWTNAAVFEKLEFTDDGRSDRQRTPAPWQWLCGQSQAELKIEKSMKNSPEISFGYM